MKQYIFLILLIGLINTSFCQENPDIISFNDVKIISKRTGSELSRVEHRCVRDSLILYFGKPDSIVTNEIEAIGGFANSYYYGNSRFSYLVGETNLTSFWLNDDEFEILVQDSIKLKVGDIYRNTLNEKNKVQKDRDNGHLMMFYDHFSYHALVFKHESKTGRIIYIYDAYSN